MVSVPGIMAVTTPAMLTVAVGLLALHAPPGAASVNVIGEPRQTADGPEIVPAKGILSTATIFVAVTDPQLLETV